MWWRNSSLVSDASSLTLHGFALLAQTTLLALYLVLLQGSLHLLVHVLSHVLLHVLLHVVMNVGAQPPRAACSCKQDQTAATTGAA